MTNKTEVPLLTAEDARRRLESQPLNIRDKLQAIADGRAIVISAADLKAKDAEIERLQGLVSASERERYATCSKLLEENESLRRNAKLIINVVSEIQQERLRMYRADRTSYREGASDVADSILMAIDAARTQESSDDK